MCFPAEWQGAALPDGSARSAQKYCKGTSKNGLKRENGQSAPNARKANEVRLYALRGGLTKQAVCYTRFHSNEVLEVTVR